MNLTDPLDANEPTLGAGTPTMADMVKIIMERLDRQDETTKLANKRLAVLVVAFTPPTATVVSPETARRQLFATNIAAGGTNLNNTGSEQTLEAPELAISLQIANLQLPVQDINSKIHNVTSSALKIERIFNPTLKTPFSKKITGVRVRPTEKLCIPSYSGDMDPTDHMTAFNIAMGRSHFTDEERDAGFCQLFVESLCGPALTWFSRLEEDSVNCFRDLSAMFLKHYIMFTRHGASALDLWKMFLRGESARFHGKIQANSLQSAHTGYNGRRGPAERTVGT